MVITFFATIFAQGQTIELSGGPGNYNISQNTNQLIIKSYEIRKDLIDQRANIVAGFRSLVSEDAGGKARVQGVVFDDQQRLILTISATEDMHKSVAQLIPRINEGKFRFSNCPITKIYRCKFQSAEFIANLARSQVSSIGGVTFDASTNIITIDDDPTFLPVVMAKVEAYDTPLPQLSVEVEVVEIKKGVGSNLGVYWKAYQDFLPDTVNVNAYADRSAPVGGLDNPLQVNKFDVAVKNINPAALGEFINYLENRGVAKSHNKVNLNVMNGKTATLRAGSEVPYQAMEAGKTINSIALDGVEISLKAVLAEQSSTLSISAIASSITGFGQNGMPVLSKSNTDTAITINNERNFVISGLERTRSTSARQGIPGLKDVPILKYLFSREIKSTEEWEVKIIMTIK